MTAPSHLRIAQQLISVPAKLVIVMSLLLTEIARPIFGPLIAVASHLSPLERLQNRISTFPRSVVLVLLVIPFGIAEPLKVYGYILLGEKHLKSGSIVVIIAHLVSFLLVERIYHAGRAQLFTYRWIAWTMIHIAWYQKLFGDIAMHAVTLASGWFRVRR